MPSTFWQGYARCGTDVEIQAACRGGEENFKKQRKARAEVCLVFGKHIGSLAKNVREVSDNSRCPARSMKAEVDVAINAQRMYLRRCSTGRAKLKRIAAASVVGGPAAEVAYSRLQEYCRRRSEPRRRVVESEIKKIRLGGG